MKLTITLIILVSVLSCSRKSDVQLDLAGIDVGRDEISSATEEAVYESHSFSSLPLINFHGSLANVQVLDASGKFIKESSININRHSYIREKLSKLINNPYEDNIEIEDIHTFEYSIESSEILKIIGPYDFNDLSKLKLRVRSAQLLESETKGIIDSLEYESLLTDIENSRLHYVLRNSPSQTRGFEFGPKARESYVLDFEVIKMDLAIKKLLSGSRIKFEVTNYEVGENDLVKWRSSILNKGSILLISKEDKDRYFFIPSGSSVEEVLDNKVFNLNSDYRMINFSKMSEPLGPSRIVAIYVIGDDGYESKKSISEERNLKEYSFVKKRNHKIEFLIQKRGIKHSVKHWKEAQGISLYENGKLKGRRTCNVNRRKIVKSSTTLDRSKYKGEFSFVFEGRSYSLESLVKEERARISSNGLTQKISLLNLPGSSDRTQVKILINSSLSSRSISQDKGNCNLVYERRQMHGGENEDWIRIKEEKFDSFSESSTQGLVGVERFMDLIIVNSQ